LILAEDNLKQIKSQNDNFIERMIRKETGANWLEEASHLNNVEWLFLNSIFVTMYASFELFLMKVATTLEWQERIQIKLSHMSGRGILEQYTNYLHLVGGIESASRERAPWGKLAHYQSVRNLLAHNGGIMQENGNLEKHKDFKFLQQQEAIMAGSVGMIRIRNTKILESFVKDTTLVTTNLLKEFNQKYPEM
jgi:hypothetical protein